MNSDLEVIEHQAPATLFGSDDPATVIDKASKIADALKDVIVKKKLVARISGKDHVLVDGWTLCGTMLGVFPVVVRTTELFQDEKSIGFEAYTEARTITGAIVGAATARCTRTEGTWKSRADYALLSMAQTRSVSKAMRIPLGFIISMAGYETSPAEEVMDLQEPRQTPSVAPQSTQAPEDEGQATSTPVGDAAAKIRRITIIQAVKREHPNDTRVVTNELTKMNAAELAAAWPEIAERIA
jgi:hypothetical protein